MGETGCAIFFLALMAHFETFAADDVQLVIADRIIVWERKAGLAGKRIEASQKRIVGDRKISGRHPAFDFDPKRNRRRFDFNEDHRKK